MDPLTAFSLACGVFQVVDFGTKIVSKCRELYKHGASSENRDIGSMAKHLADLAAELRLPNNTQSPRSASQLYQDDQELLNLAEQCSETATKLKEELQKLRIQGQPRKRDAFRKAIKTIWRNDTIQHIQRSLEQYRKTLDTRILISLRQQVHLVANEQSNGFLDIDRKLQNLIIGVSRDPKTFDELKELVTAENASSKQHTSQEFQKHREMIAADESHKKFLKSLHFPDIHARQEGIEEAHKQTFEWIFDKPGGESQPWHPFIDWLQNGHGTYWISGKAGSGKSTLMSLICQDPRTKAALRIWSGSSEIFMPKYFFWSPGTYLQRSLAGLLRSLIFQIVDRFPELMPVLADSSFFAQHRLEQLPTWTETRLQAMLQYLLSHGLKAHRVCIFIDGLDEFDGNQTILLNLIRNLKQLKSIKFCVSSRPEPFLRDELSSSTMLKLQDLTEPDIRRYVSDELGAAYSKASQVPYWSLSLDNMIFEIVKKAEGVFLWVKLAVRDQLDGIRDKDDAKQLKRRLEALPGEIVGLYEHMLQKINKVHHEEVAQYLQLVIHTEDLSLFHLALAVHKRVDDITAFSSKISIRDIRLHCDLIRERVATTCRGLLEVREVIHRQDWLRSVETPSKPPHPSFRAFLRLLETRKQPLEQRDDLIEMKFYQEHTHVDFLHRTAFDFFKENEKGKGFLEANASANPHPQVLYVKALIASLMIIPVPTDEDVRSSIRSIMFSAWFAEEETRVAQPALMNLLNCSMTLLYERSPAQPPKVHWCRAWRIPSFYYDELTEDNGVVSNDEFKAHFPMDFLGFAAFLGLDRYVEHILELQSGHWKPGYVDYLLGCVICRLNLFRYPQPMLWSQLKIAVALLKRGADPNMEFSGSTVWGHFLRTLYHWYCYRSLSQRASDDSASLEAEWRNTALAFLGSGANVNEKVYCELGFTSNDASHSASSMPLITNGYSMELHLSARSLLQQCFARYSFFSEFEQTLTASGATLDMECTEIIFFVRDRDTPEVEVNSKLSKQQLNQFSTVLEESLQTAALNPDEYRRVIDDQVVELFQTLDMDKLYKEAREEERLQEETQADQSISNPDGPSDESSIDDADPPGLEVEDPASALSSRLEDSTLCRKHEHDDELEDPNEQNCLRSS